MPESIVSAPGFTDPNQTLSGPIIGIIYPPPEVRNIVDKTASFVARNGFEFENKIQQSEKGNKKFGFLNPGDPYHAYYQHKVKEFKEGEATQPNFPGLKNLSISSVAQKQQELLKQVTEQQFVPKDPPPDFEFIADPPSISALDLDIVKLTAQFVARNGRQFLTNLMNREQRNYQFDFLRPQHSLFQYFTKLLEQYTKILIPPKDLQNKLQFELETKNDATNSVLEQVKYRANWLKHEEAQRRREEEKIERERVAYAQIDWHDFVVVEVVEYQPYESGNFPPPTTPDEVGARVLMEQRYQEDDNDIEMQIESDEEVEQQVPHSNVKMSMMENRVKDNNQVQDMDEASSEDESTTSKQAPVPVLPPPSHDKVIVRKYDPKQAHKISKPPTTSEEYLISPITGEKVPASQVAEHMRITLLDPRWVEQRDRQIEKAREENVYAGGAAIEASLKQLAERRTDIFGVGDEEAAIGKKLGEEEPRKDDRVTWDGHTSSVEAATRAAARNVSLEDQIHQIHKVKGLIPDEEKEKIGPKPMMTGSTVSAPPKPPSIPHQMNMPGNIPPPPHHVPPHGPPMMMPQMRPIRPPMMPPPFPVPGFPVMPPLAPAPPVQMEMNEPEEPLNKRPRQEDHLIPEDVFLQHHKGPITIQVQVPSSTDKPEWKLNGQLLTVNIGLGDTIQKLKQKVQEETDMPPAKQKISHDGIFFKDNNTCAYYNLLSGVTVHLQIKERGGRKK